MYDLLPTAAVIRALALHGDTWVSLVRDVERPLSTHPYHQSPTRRVFVGHEWLAFVEPSGEQWMVVGARRRRKPADGPAEPVVGIETRQPKSSRRGPSGRFWPTSTADLLNILRKMDGVTVLHGRTHAKVLIRGQVEAVSMPLTPSDYRSLINTCQELKRHGVDVRRPGK